MLDIQKRIGVIERLLQEDTDQSLTYAALECRLTLEYLCYERFKLTYSYLSQDDLKNWVPKDVVKQVSEDVDDNIDKEFTLSISTQPTDGKNFKTKEDFEALEYVALGTQSALNLNIVHSLWHGVSNVALHLPIPNISSGDLTIYQNKERIKKKVQSVIDFLRPITGNLLMAGSLGEVFSFDCFICGMTIKRPVKKLVSPSVVNCVNPKCDESYLLEPSETEKNVDITRRIFKFECIGCKRDLEVPGKIFRELRFNQQLNIVCSSCQSTLELVMRPLMKLVEDKNSHNEQNQMDA